MPYAILRFQKKKAGGLGACYAHNERKKETYKSNPDINISRGNENYHLILPKQTYAREARRMISAAKCKTRKDSTVMVETLITASPEFINALTLPEQREYFQRALDFVGQKIGKENIISAIVHNDEKTPHMHLTFCPITQDKRLSAKELLGNQAQLSRWQTDYHKTMSARWPELERGLSSIETGRKHIPVWLFKAAERLDKQAAMIEAALANINALNAKKQRGQALGLLAKWLPQAERFAAQIKMIDGNIKSLELAKQEAEKRAREAENTAESKVDAAIARMQSKIAEKDKEIWEAWQEAQKLRRQILNAEAMISKIPLELREKLLNKTGRDRGHRQ